VQGQNGGKINKTPLRSILFIFPPKKKHSPFGVLFKAKKTCRRLPLWVVSASFVFCGFFCLRGFLHPFQQSGFF
jgi:hypothetical protein